MLVIIYLAVLVVALCFVSKLLLPEMAKPPLPGKKKAIRGAASSSDISGSNEPGNRIEKLETLLAEKNKNIGVLQAELKVFIVQMRDFDKIKSVLEEEIHRLREQNRIFRSELGLPATAQPKENSERLFI